MGRITQLLLIYIDFGQRLQWVAGRYFIVFDRAQQLALDRLAIDGQLLVRVTDSVPRQTNYPLDVVDARVIRIAEHHDIPTLGVTDRDDLGLQYRQANTIGEFVDQDEVANLQRRLHRPRRNLERLNQKRAQDQHHCQHREKGFSVLDQQRLLVQTLQGAFLCLCHLCFISRDSTTAPRRQPDPVKQRQQAGDGHSDHQQQRKVDMHSQSCNAPNCLLSARRGRLPGVFPHCPLASSASCPLSVFPAASSSGWRHRRNTWPARSCAVP